MSAILFGSISTLADTSELQREAFNRAFEQHGLDWEWDRDTYRELLVSNGGADRIAEVARQRGEDVDAEAVHATKSKLFQETLASASLEPRPGVTDTIAEARLAGWSVGLVTTTSRANISALLAGLENLEEGDFDVITDVATVADPKPDPAVYRAALDSLGEVADASVAIEDNVGGVQAATDAGITCVAFPNQNTASHDFSPADVVDRISFEELSTRVGAA